MFVSTFASAYLVLIALRHEEEERQALEIAEQKKEGTIFEHVADSANQKIDRLAAATASDFDHFAVLANQNAYRSAFDCCWVREPRCTFYASGNAEG